MLKLFMIGNQNQKKIVSSCQTAMAGLVIFPSHTRPRRRCLDERREIKIHRDLIYDAFLLGIGRQALPEHCACQKVQQNPGGTNEVAEEHAVAREYVPANAIEPDVATHEEILMILGWGWQ